MDVQANKGAASIQEHNKGPAMVWGAPGAAYDEVSRGIADAIEHCVERLMPQPDERVLDIATGTGWTARRIAELGANVTGVDFAAEAIDAAMHQARLRNFDMKFEVGDCEGFNYEDNSFDAVISTFGVMFASNPEKAAKEMARICRPGGRIALATWTPDGNVFNMFKVMKAYMPPPPTTPPPSPFEWGNIDRVEALLGDDFDLTFEKGTSYYREPDGERAWEVFSKSYGPLRALHGKLDATTQGALKKDFITFHDGHKAELGICVPRDYWVIYGTKK